MNRRREAVALAARTDVWECLAAECDGQRYAYHGGRLRKLSLSALPYILLGVSIRRVEAIWEIAPSN